MKTVLEIAQDALYDIGVTPPSSLESATDFVQNQVKRLFYNEAKDLRRLRIWKQQKKVHTFDTESARVAYPLPADFYAMAGNTGYDQDSSLRLNGPIGDSQWNDRLYGYQLVGAPYGFRIFGPDFNPTTAGGQFKVNPSPPAGVTLSFEYLTANLFLPPNWTAGETTTTNDYRNANGNIYKYTTGGAVHASTPPSHTSGSASDNAATALYISAPYETIIKDEDFCLFDEDVVTMGLMWRWKKSKGQDFTQERIDWQNAIDAAKTRFEGAYRGKMSRVSGNSRRYTVPDGGWSF